LVVILALGIGLGLSLSSYQAATDDFDPNAPNCDMVDSTSEAPCHFCLNRIGCGWCQETMTCVEGTESGPSGGSCSEWYFVSQNCP